MTAAVTSGISTPSDLMALLLGAAIAGSLTAIAATVFSISPKTFVPQPHLAPTRRLLRALGRGLGAALVMGGAGGVIGWLGGVASGPVHTSIGCTALALTCLGMAAKLLGLLPLSVGPTVVMGLAGMGGDGWRGALATGALSPLLAAPWMSPIVVTLLCLALHIGHAMFGVVLLGAFAAGLALSWLGAALSLEPPAGVWIEVVRLALASVAGLVALYFLILALPALSAQLIWIRHPIVWGLATLSLAVGCGVSMLTSRALARSLGLRSVGATFGCLGLGVALFGGGALPIDATVPDVAWFESHDGGLARARLEHRPVVIDFTADWCQACKQLERETYVDINVRRAAMRFLMIRVDCTAMDDPIKALFDRYNIEGLPTVIFVDSAGNVLAKPRLTGFVPAARFLELLAMVQ